MKQQKTKVKKFVKTKRLKRTEIGGNQIKESEVESEKFEYDSNIEMIQPIVKIKRLKQTEIDQIEKPTTKSKKIVKIKKLKQREIDDNQIEVDHNQIEVDHNQLDLKDNQIEVDHNQIEVDHNQIEESQIEDDKFEYIITKRLKKVVKTKRLKQTEIDYSQVEENQAQDENLEYDSVDENEMKQETGKIERKRVVKTKKRKQTEIDHNPIEKSEFEDENEMRKDEKKIKLFSSGRSKLVRAQILENNIENIEDEENQLFLKCRTAEVHQRFLVHPTGTVIQNQ